MIVTETGAVKTTGATTGPPSRDLVLISRLDAGRADLYNATALRGRRVK